MDIGAPGVGRMQLPGALSKDPLRPSQHEETPQGVTSATEHRGTGHFRAEAVKMSCYLTILPLLNSIASIFFTRPFMEKIKLFWLYFRGIYGLSGVIKAQQ